MIVTTDIGNILYRDCKAFGIDIVPDGETLTGELKSERIVIHTKKQQPGKYWKKSFAEVNLCVPNLSENEANTIRLNELERKADKLLDCLLYTSLSRTKWFINGICLKGMKKERLLLMDSQNYRFFMLIVLNLIARR